MAKREEFRPKSKITVMMFQLEGTDETLQEGIRTIGQSLGVVLKPMRSLPAKTNDKTSEELIDETEVETVTPEEEEITPKNGGTSQTAKPRSPVVLDLDLNSAKPALKDFCESKKVGDGDSERYLVISYWLKHHFKLAEVTMDHIHTCYRFLDWQTPKDASSPFRNMKKQGWFAKGTAKGAYIINHVGENKVMGMK
jgi:hypothetical protein